MRRFRRVKGGRGMIGCEGKKNEEQLNSGLFVKASRMTLSVSSFKFISCFSRVLSSEFFRPF